MRVLELWRYPVKSMQGERLTTAEVGHRGVVGDRAWAVRDVERGRILTARREPALLDAAAGFVDDGPPRIALPDGTASSGDADLSAWLGYRVELVAAGADRAEMYETPADFEREDGTWVQWEGATGTFHDSERTRVSIVSRTSLGRWDVRRFRPNMVVADGELSLLGSTVAVGTAELDVVKRIARCVVVTRSQPGGIGRDLDVLRTINSELDACFGVGAVVRTAGKVAVGDAVSWRQQEPSRQATLPSSPPPAGRGSSSG